MDCIRFVGIVDIGAATGRESRAAARWKRSIGNQAIEHDATVAWKLRRDYPNEDQERQKETRFGQLNVKEYSADAIDHTLLTKTK